MFKRNTWKSTVYSGIMILVMTILLTYVSYSWIKREWAPSIKQDGIMITTNGSLVLNLGEGEGYEEEQSITDLLGVETFVLQPVSNCSGKSDDFFTLDFGGGPGNELYKWLNCNEYNGSYKDMGAANGYIEFSFVLRAPTATQDNNKYRYIYLEDDSYIVCAEGESGAAAKALRMSISFGDHDPTLFGTYTEEELAQMMAPEDPENPDKPKPPMGITNEKDHNQAYLAHMASYYKVYDEANENNCILADKIMKNGNDTGYDLHKTVTLHTFGQYNGRDESGELSATNVLGTVQEGVNAAGVRVTVRIWVEGTDPHCESQISGQAINLKLRFGSFSDDELAAAQEQGQE